MGKWEEMFDGKVIEGMVWCKCDKCGYIITVTMSQGYHFCPICGDKKDKEK